MPVATDVALQEMENHKAETGDEWVANEMQVLIGGQKYWNWNVMDADTRCILASHLYQESRRTQVGRSHEVSGID